MKNILLAIIFFSSIAVAQELKISFNTGDSDIDRHLTDINAYGKAEYDFFKKELSLKFGITAKEIDRYVYTEKVSPGDLYYACAISNTTGRKVNDVIVLYKDKKGWGAVAKELGIKPGSKEFHRLKSKSISGIGKVKSMHTDNGKGKGKSKGKK